MDAEIAFKSYTKMLEMLGRVELPLAARGTLNALAFESRDKIVNTAMPREFILRNTFEQRGVRYDPCSNTFNISDMESSAGQLEVVKFQKGLRDMDDLRQQELGLDIGPRKGSTLVRTPTLSARTSKSFLKPVAKANRPSKGEAWPGLKSLEDRAGVIGSGRMKTGNRIKRGHALARKYFKGQTYILPISTKLETLGVFRLIRDKIVLLHKLSPNHHKIKPRPTVKLSFTEVVNQRAGKIWVEQSERRIDKALRKTLLGKWLA